MKTKLLILSLLFFQINQAQMGRGMHGGGQRMGGQGRGMNPGNAAFSPVKAENLAGIILYDETAVIKKLKIKNARKQQKIKSLIRSYNQQNENLKLKHFQALKETRLYLQQKRKEAMMQKDFELMQQAKQDAMQKLAPVRKEAKTLQAELNKEMLQVLSKKQLKKWQKYQKQKRKELNPHNFQRQKGTRKQMHRGGGF